MQITKCDDGALRVRGSRAELIDAARRIESVALERRSESEIAVRRAEAGAPVRWTVRRGADPVRVRTADGGAELTLRGGWKLLSIAAWFRALAARPRRSVRLEWHAGHCYLAQKSTVLDLGLDLGEE